MTWTPKPISRCNLASFGVPKLPILVVILASVALVPAVSSELDVVLEPANLPPQVVPGESMRMDVTLTLDCQELLIARATVAELDNDISFQIRSDGRNGLGGPQGLELRKPISACDGNETVSIADWFLVGLSWSAEAFSSPSLKILVEPTTSEPYKESWNTTLATETGFDNKTNFSFAGNQPEIVVDGTLQLTLRFVNEGNGRLLVSPKLEGDNGAACGVFEPSQMELKPREGMRGRIEFTTEVVEPLGVELLCTPFAQVEVLEGNSTREIYVMEGPPVILTSTALRSEEVESPMPSQAMAAMLLAAAAFLKTRTHR